MTAYPGRGSGLWRCSPTSVASKARTQGIPFRSSQDLSNQVPSPPNKHLCELQKGLCCCQQHRCVGAVQELHQQHGALLVSVAATHCKQGECEGMLCTSGPCSLKQQQPKPAATTQALRLDQGPRYAWPPTRPLSPLPTSPGSASSRRSSGNGDSPCRYATSSGGTATSSTVPRALQGVVDVMHRGGSFAQRQQECDA